MTAQIFIAIFGVSAVWLSQSANETQRKWSPVLGLLGQPFWFWTTYTHGQYGMFALCFLYAACYLRGYRQFWMDGRGIRWSPKP